MLVRVDDTLMRWTRYLKQPVRFVIVGTCNTALTYITYCVCLHLGAEVWSANLVGWTLGMLMSFFAQGAFVFKNRDHGRLWRFLVTSLVIYSIQTFSIGLLVARGYNASLAGLLVLPGTVVVSFIAQKYFVFGLSGTEARATSVEHEQ